ncbi:hypothetical protein BJ166DRAFT_472864 [Pestalotiopsis sp. NC0098]|nr:hypothetical protein BJ166DRAFT_472864 [Pestalotiopsis sp. NC0098]
MSHDQESVHRELELWNSTCWTGDGYTFSYTFSPAWNKLFDTECTAYDDLERRRAVCGARRLPWQKTREDERDLIALSRKRCYKPMNDALWRLCPLGVQMRRYLQKPYSHTERSLSWNTLLRDWDEFQVMSLSDEFRSSLSPPQRFSFEVLEAWWTAAHCDPRLPRAARQWMEQQMDQVYLNNPTLKDVCANATQALTSLSLYHASCFCLFLNEFHPGAWEPYMSYQTLLQLQNRRFSTSVQATMQQAAYGVLHPNPHGPSHAYPKLALNDTLFGRNLAKAPDKDSPKAPDPPFYLWDTSARQTVATSTLKIFPKYVCISHTWGRWRMSSSANVPGVPWRVPQNTLYDVCRLPEQLAQLGFEYIWFDLFCIPQDGSKRAEQEIANQSAIFKSSQRCLAWINDVESWDVVEHALDWMCIKYLTIASVVEKEKCDRLLKKLAHGADHPIALMRVVFPSNMVSGEPSSWFSSLWTLQECVLCPDIELYSKHWCRLNDRRGAALPIRPLMFSGTIEREPATMDGRRSYGRFLAENPFEHPPSTKDWFIPLGVYRLLQLCELTRLDNLLTVGMPTSVLINANVRQSTDNRAPAIMSALGVTDWYQREMGQKKKSQQLVCGLYPHAFVREAAETFGALFYESSTPNSHISFRNLFLRRSSLGTMLPFTSKHGWFSGIVGTPAHAKIDPIDHESVSTWKIAADGSVYLSEVGIAIKSGERPEQPVRGQLRWTVPSRKKLTKPPDSGTYSGDDIHAKLEELAGVNTIYAIALYEDCYVQHGILLQRLHHWVPRVDYLIRMGNYYLEHTSLPPTTRVRWRVL